MTAQRSNRFKRGKHVAVSIEAAAQTDVGCVRSNNEDCFGIDKELQVYIVCDGMGGSVGGEIASRVGVDAFLRSLRQNRYATSESSREPLVQAAVAANVAVLARAQVEPALHGMGATLVAAQIENSRLQVVNIGDSRAYVVRQAKCTQVTVDHSYLQEQVRLGFMTQAMADQSPMQSVITRAIGMQDGVVPDLFTLDLEDGDLILLTTDGLTRHVSDEDIAEVVTGAGETGAGGTDDLDTRCSRLIELAKRRGGSDNVTCILLQHSSL